MLRYTSAAILLLTASTASAQRAAGEPQPGSPQRPAQTTEIRGADQNNTRNRTSPPRATPQTPPTNVRPGTAQPGTVQPGTAQRQSREANYAPGSNQASSFDSHVADCLILGNQKEVAILKFGMERTTHDEVKKLAKKMVDDHEQAISSLRKFASQEHAKSELTASLSDNEQKNRDVAITREARKVGDITTSNSGEMNDKMHRLARRSAELCVVLSREELGKYEGEEFDQAFVGHQIGTHLGMLAQLKAAGEETSGELSQVIMKSQKTTKEHKQQLEDLMNKISEKEHGDKKKDDK